MTKVQIVMPGINLWAKYTKPAIDSVQVAMVRAKEHNIECRLLFIDNASTDETKDEAGKYVGDLFAHKRNEERWGFQKSVNYGVNDAWERGYDYVLVCNNDILLHPEAIWRLVQRFECGATIRITEKPEMNTAASAEIPDAPPPSYRDWDVGMVTAMDVRGEVKIPSLLDSINTKEKENVAEAPHPNFSAFMVNRNVWQEVGEFDELFAPAYFEDNDYHYRMKLAGLAAIVYPPALFFHFGSGTQNEGNENGQPIVPGPLFENNRAAYAKKWGGVPTAETFTKPYDQESNSIRTTQQNPAP